MALEKIQRPHKELKEIDMRFVSLGSVLLNSSKTGKQKEGTGRMIFLWESFVFVGLKNFKW